MDMCQHIIDWVVAVGTTLAAVAALLSWLEARTARKHAQELRVEVNHRLSQLLVEHGKSQHAAGRREGLEVGEKKGV
jgi:hypothetical protein